MLGTTDAGGRLSADLSALDQLSAWRSASNEPAEYLKKLSAERLPALRYGRWGGYNANQFPGDYFVSAGEANPGWQQYQRIMWAPTAT